MSDTIVVAVIAAIPGLVGAIIAFLNNRLGQKTHDQSKDNSVQISAVKIEIDGRLSQFIEEVRSAAHAAGVLEQKEKEHS